MAVDMFLKMDDVPGGSTDDKHRGEIEIQSYSFGLTQVGNVHFGGGGGAGKVSMQDFHFSAPVNLSSPVLMKACATGQHFKKATLTVRKSGEDRGIEFVKVTLTDVLITGYSNGNESNDTYPTDQVSMAYAKIELLYTSPNPQGDATSAEISV